MNETITINIDTTEISNMNRAINDLRRVVQDLNRDLDSSGSAWAVLDSSLNLMIGTLGLLAISSSDLRNIPENIDRVASSFSELADGLAAKEGLVGAFGGALKALPLLAVVAGLGYLAHALSNTNTGFQTTRRHIRELNQSMNESREAHREMTREIDINDRANQILIDRLRRLQDQENLSAGQRQELAAITDRLSDDIGSLNFEIDASTGKLDENSATLLDTIGYHNEFSTALRNISADQDLWFDASDNYAALEIDIQRITNAQADLDDQLARGEITQRQHYDQMALLRREYNEVRNAQSELGDEMDILTDRMEINAQRQEEIWMGLAENHALSFGLLNEAQQGVVNDLVDRWDLYHTRSTEMFSQHNQDAEIWGWHTNEAGERVQGSFAVTEETQQYALQAMIDNMRENRLATEQWSENLDYIAENVCADFAEHLRQLGPDAAAYVQAMRDDTTGLVHELADEFQLGGASATQNIANGLGDYHQYVLPVVEEMVNSTRQNMGDRINQHFPEVGREIPTYLADGIASAGSMVATAVQTMMSEAEAKTNDTGEVYEAIGRNVPEGYAAGVEAATDQAETATRRMANECIRSARMGFDCHSPSRVFRSIGQDVVAGLNVGILNRENTVMNTVRRIANNITREMQRALQINSPSRVMREGIGRFIPEGVAAGIDKYAGAAVDSVHKLGNDLINVNIPSVESMIGMGPSMRYAGVGGKEKIHVQPPQRKMMFQMMKRFLPPRKIFERNINFYNRIKMKAKIKMNIERLRAKARVVLIPIAEPEALLQNRQQEPTPLNGLS